MSNLLRLTALVKGEAASEWQAHIVYECGKLYPHRNLYFITSDEWGLYALQAVLLSGLVSIYSTRMRGGYLRFQAQYLRRIRLPYWQDADEKLNNALGEAANSRNIAACNATPLTPDH